MNEINEEDVRLEVRNWLSANWDPESDLLTWRNKLADSGWGTPTWPKEWWGRGLPVALSDVVAQEFRAAGAVGIPGGVGAALAAATLLEHASEIVKKHYLRPIITGEDTWCQLFSEPGSGSDLAGLTTRAERDGDDWVINGQKVWNTSAHHARWGMLLARTNWDVPKHSGITYFIIEMDQPGVVVRPLRQSNGHSSFNEVFLTDARVSEGNLIGEVDRGWTVALATLAHERRVARIGSRRVLGKGRALDEYRDELREIMEPYTWYPQRAGRPDLLVDRANKTGASSDPAVRQEIARVLALARASEWTGRRAKAAQKLGRPPGPEGSIAKLCTSNIAKASARAHTLISGGEAMLAESEDTDTALVSEILVSVPAQSIAGGTDEIQRNIISERVLGLPKLPSVDSGKAFRDVPKNLAS